MTPASRRPPAEPDLANVFVPYEELHRQPIEPPKRTRLYRTTPIRDPFH